MPDNPQSASRKPDNTAHQISNLRREIQTFLSTEMAQAGIQGCVPSHGDIIVTLLKHESMTMRDLSTAIQRDPSTVTTLVKKLSRLGLVTLTDNPRDTRSRLVSLTERGKALKEAFYPISAALAETLWHGISDDERDQFRSILDRMIQNFQAT